MQKWIKGSFIALCFVAFILILVKAWWLYQHKYVCEPKVRSSVERFLDSIVSNEYESLSDKSMFVNKAQFEQIKGAISKTKVYSLEIRNWTGDGAAYVIIKFRDATYALMVEPTPSATFCCWGVQYTVLTIRE
jgi:hypothetical protein